MLLVVSRPIKTELLRFSLQLKQKLQGSHKHIHVSRFQRAHMFLCLVCVSSFELDLIQRQRQREFRSCETSVLMMIAQQIIASLVVIILQGNAMVP